MNSPIVSIIVPCYNQAQYLNECLQSVFDQTFNDWECIIVNDGSPDNTEEIAKQWINKDQRFRYYIKENGGVSSARNFGVLNSLGEYIIALDGDDKIGEDYVKLTIDEFEKDNSLCLVYSNANFFGEINQFWDLPAFELKSFLIDNCIYCSAVFKKADFLKTGGYDENLVYGYEDWEFWINLISQYQTPKVKKIDYIGFYYRRKNNSRDVEFLNDAEKRSKTKFEIYKKHHKLYEKYFGDYLDNLKKIDQIHKEIDRLHKSKKYVLKLFMEAFFGLKLKRNN